MLRRCPRPCCRHQRQPEEHHQTAWCDTLRGNWQRGVHRSMSAPHQGVVACAPSGVATPRLGPASKPGRGDPRGASPPLTTPACPAAAQQHRGRRMTTAAPYSCTQHVPGPVTGHHQHQRCRWRPFGVDAPAPRTPSSCGGASTPRGTCTSLPETSACGDKACVLLVQGVRRGGLRQQGTRAPHHVGGSCGGADGGSTATTVSDGAARCHAHEQRARSPRPSTL